MKCSPIWAVVPVYRPEPEKVSHPSSGCLNSAGSCVQQRSCVQQHGQRGGMASTSAVFVVGYGRLGTAQLGRNQWLPCRPITQRSVFPWLHHRQKRAGREPHADHSIVGAAAEGSLPDGPGSRLPDLHHGEHRAAAQHQNQHDGDRTHYAGSRVSEPAPKPVSLR